MGVVVFDYAEWAAKYTTLAAFTSEDMAANYFDIATGLLSNRDSSPVPYNPDATPPVTTRKRILYLATAHIAELNGPDRAGTVGAITEAHEGSAGVKLDAEFAKRAGWWGQTQWGGLYWQLTARYRTMRYIPGVERFRQPRTYRP